VGTATGIQAICGKRPRHRDRGPGKGRPPVSSPLKLDRRPDRGAAGAWRS
jgi:hypothetical protein